MQVTAFVSLNLVKELGFSDLIMVSNADAIVITGANK